MALTKVPGSMTNLTKADVGLGQVDNTSDADKPVPTSVQTALDTKAPINNPTFTGTVSGVTKTHVGLGNVDNTSDAAKPVSTAQQAALDLKAPLASPTFTGTVNGITKSMVGLGNVDNTSDANKPISSATQTALDGKATTAQGAKADTALQSVVQGTGITVDNTDPLNPVINASGGGSGDVVGPASSTAGNLAAFDDTTGKLLEDSGKSASDFQTASTKLTDIAALAVADGNIMVGDGTTWVAESGATARTSLGVGTGDSPQFTAINLGHASDTTLARVSAGVISVEGNPVPTINTGVLTVTATSTGPAEIRLREDTDNGTNHVGFKAPAAITADAVWELPAADGTSGQVLQTNGSKVLSFVDAGGAAGWTLLQTQTPSAASSVSFISGFSSTYDHYVFVFEGLILSNSTNLDMRVSIDGGSSFISTTYEVGWTELSGASALTGGTNTTEARLCRTSGTGTNRSISGELHIIINNTSYASIAGFLRSGTRLATLSSGNIDAGSRINGLQFYPTAGTETGIIKMFGVDK